MDKDAIYDKICDLVCETLDVSRDQITETTSFDDLGADSFDKLELVTALEDEFDLQLDDDVLSQIATVEQAIEAIEQAE